MADSLGMMDPLRQNEHAQSTDLVPAPPAWSPELVRDGPARAEDAWAPEAGAKLPTSSIQHRASAVRSHRLLGFGLVILAALCWSTAGIFITRAMEGGGITPISLAFWRVAFTFACLLLALLLFRRDLLRVARRDLPWLVGMGALALGTFRCWILSVLTNGLSIATVIQCNAPLSSRSWPGSSGERR
jgi:hypothetical protein